jgi:hypothetical protein
MKPYDIFKTVEPITETMVGVKIGVDMSTQEDICIMYDFANCKSVDPIERVHPVFRSTLKALRGDYAS